jgi:hypothetical protein
VGSIFVACDWINLEGRLTASFAGDPTLQRLLDEELTGGPKVHAITAAHLYNIDPADAKKVKVNLQGQPVDAYEGGKRLRHGWHYGMRERKMVQTFWITMAEAEKVNATLTEMHPEIPKWWRRLGDEVFGVGQYRCWKCGDLGQDARQCGTCATANPKWDGWHQEPTREMRTPFGRRRLYLGRRSDSMNALISQLPQGSGASMWYRTLMRLHGIDPSGDPWPCPPGMQVWNGRYANLTHRAAADVATGTYDSFLVRCPGEQREAVLAWLAWTVEQPWPQLGGKRFPADLAVGANWEKRDEENEDGLSDVGYQPFSSGRPPGLV